MEQQTKKIEKLVVIAERQPPGDKWKLVGGTQIYPSLTDTLEAYFQATGTPCEFRLAPLQGKLFVIQTEEIEIPKEKPKTFSLYGEY